MTFELNTRYTSYVVLKSEIWLFITTEVNQYLSADILQTYSTKPAFLETDTMIYINLTTLIYSIIICS